MIYTDANAMYFSSFHMHTLQLLSVGEKKGTTGKVAMEVSVSVSLGQKHKQLNTTQTGSCVNFFYLFFL